VAAASYEVRKYGVHSAMPAAKAIRLCPHAMFVKPRFEVYRKVSQKIREIFFLFTDLVEPLSLDEAYLDVTENHIGLPSATLIAQKIRQLINQKTNLTASAGVAYNKFLAKMASDLNKPDGMAVILPEEAEAFLSELPIGAFHGVGDATKSKMNRLGITNGMDLREWSEIDLVKQFGKVGRHYYRIVRGIDRRKVKPDRIRKSIGKERTFSEDVDDLNWIHNFLKELAGKISEVMKSKQAAGKTVTLKVRYGDFETVTRSTSFSHYLDQANDIAQTALQLLEETQVGNRKVRLLGITMSNLNLNERGHFKQLEIPFE
jgi:DNA polymerase-4